MSLKPMVQERPWPVVTVAFAGYALCLLSLLGNAVHLGSGFGWRHVAAAIVGGVVAALAWAALLAGEAPVERRRVALSGAGAAMILAAVAADRIGVDHLRLGSAPTFLVAAAVVLVLLSGERS